MLNTLHGDVAACAQTLERAYLLKLGGRVVERPQYMFMRIAIGIHGEDLEAREGRGEALSWETWDVCEGGQSVSNGAWMG